MNLPSKIWQIKQISPWNHQDILPQIPLPSFHATNKLPRAFKCLHYFFMGKIGGRNGSNAGCVEYFIVDIDVGIFTGPFYNQSLKAKDIHLRKMNRCNLKFCRLFKCPALPLPLVQIPSPWEKVAFKCLGFTRWDEF